MLSILELNKVWAKTLKVHAQKPLLGEHGLYRPIGEKSLILLEELWAGAQGRVLDIGMLLAAGRKVVFYGDPHYGHANIIHMCHRPFDTVEQMDGVIFENVCKAAEDADLVVFLGDYSLCNPIAHHRRIQNELGPKHIALMGNHDTKGVQRGQWAKAGALASLAFSVERALIKTWVDSTDAELSVLVDWDRLPKVIHFGAAHWPVPAQRLPGTSWLNIHGHIHNRQAQPLGINCSVEALNFEPKGLEVLLTANVMDQLVRRQSNPNAFDQDWKQVPGDSR